MSSLLKITKSEIKNLARTLKITLQGLHKLIRSVSYNYAFHTSFDDESSKSYHWHLEVYPKLSTYGGFEKSTGVYINTLSPEIAADMLRSKIIV
jgi:UDPglucose--hexose-1-phosphate uridylyltransferase